MSETQILQARFAEEQRRELEVRQTIYAVLVLLVVLGLSALVIGFKTYTIPVTAIGGVMLVSVGVIAAIAAWQGSKHYY